MPSSSPTPLFSPGSVVRVLPDTTPGVRPMHAEGMLMRFVLRGRRRLLRHSDKQQKETPGVGESACLLRYTISSSLHTITNPCVLSENLGENLVLRVPFLCYFGLMSVMLIRIVLGFARALI